MNIIVAHNYYQLPGGEDRVFETETALLRSRGHRVVQFRDDNRRIPSMSSKQLGIATLWNRESYNRLARLVRESNAKIVHFHNTFPLISPAGYYAARSAGAAVVQTIHNYRLLCPSAIFYRDGHPCEDCAGRLLPWPGVVHRCYRNSRSATAVAGLMLALHRAIGTWARKVDAYIALTEFAKRKLVENGLPSRKVHVKPVFLPEDPALGRANQGYGLFIGRLVEEKGIRTLLEAWASLPESIPLKILGDGPLASLVGNRASSLAQVEWRKRVSREEFWDLLKGARFLVVPSLWYEGLPGVIVEALAVGCPLIVSKLGSLTSLVEHGRTGLHFIPGDPRDLADKVRYLISDEAVRQRFQKEARLEFETRYSAETNYSILLGIYGEAIRRMKDC